MMLFCVCVYVFVCFMDSVLFGTKTVEWRFKITYET